MPIRLTQPQSAAAWQTARELVLEYGQSLHLDLSFQNFDHELEQLAAEYGPPTGAFFVADDGVVPVGCVGLRRFSATVAEIKRLYVVPSARGQRIGHLLATRIVDAARSLGYQRVLLDTLPSMTAAHALYTGMGFTTTRAYRFNPVPGTVYLMLDL